VPKLADGTLVPPLPQSGMGFPNIPGVTYAGLKTTRYLFNYGPNFLAAGIPTVHTVRRHRRQRHRGHPPAGCQPASRDVPDGASRKRGSSFVVRISAYERIRAAG